jgi:hypothetical protein
MRIHLIIPAGAVTAAALLVACGGATHASGSRSPVGTVRGDAEFIAFTRCMRAHGVNMSDPVHRPGHTGLTLMLPEMAPATVTAYNACKPIIQNVINAKQAHARATAASDLPALVRYAQCMRQRGIPMLDPNPQGQLSLGDVPGSSAIGRQSPQFHQADQACRHLLPTGVFDNGTGP